MRTRLEVIKATQMEGKILFHVEEDIEENLVATGQLITDQDNVAFIYLLDNGSNYIYLSFKEPIWSKLSDLVTNDDKPYIKVGKQEIELTHFLAELHYLIDNIDGNANYGVEMEQKVRQYFINT
ncbi:hypothetical protein LC087_01650 [Bacillus carboniphilus]|uniref:Uncharacterized protein n=1 Tax=Bacillus carboniphilus TaxID=86663 RepID=A0ABY9JU99_9BACI|nr:hypothetical protein [Bacillus carboniphilus]WLR42955.1 hypothetical protein LC087_01650 [Bacillus carboniphilus]